MRTWLQKLEVFVFLRKPNQKIYDLTQYMLKKTIHFSIAGQLWIFTSPLRSSVNINHQPPLGKQLYYDPYSMPAPEVFKLGVEGRGRGVGGITVSKRVRGMFSCTFLIFSKCYQILLKMTNVFSKNFHWPFCSGETDPFKLIISRSIEICYT